MGLGILQDVDHDLAADEILGRLAMRYRGDQRGACRALELEIEGEALN